MIDFELLFEWLCKHLIFSKVIIPIFFFIVVTPIVYTSKFSYFEVFSFIQKNWLRFWGIILLILVIVAISQ